MSRSVSLNSDYVTTLDKGQLPDSVWEAGFAHNFHSEPILAGTGLHSGQSHFSMGNTAYQVKSLEQELHVVRLQNAELEKRNLILETQHNTLLDAYQALLKIVGGNGTSGTTTHISLKQSDYPEVNFWFKRDWSSYEKDHPREFDGSGQRGKVQASKGVNVSMRYVELVNGEIISGDRASEMRRFARSIWVLLARKGTPPPTWGAADMESRKLYCVEMSTRFPELSLCELDWKAEQIATDNYPSWHNTWSKQKDTIKKEETSQAPDLSTQAKRRHEESVILTNSTKRAKVRGKEGGNTDKTAVNLDKHDMVTITDETAVANPALSIHVNGMPLTGKSMAFQDVGSHDVAMKIDETEVANTAPSNHVNGMPPTGISMALQDVGSHKMTGRISSELSSDELPIEKNTAINMEVVKLVETVAVPGVNLGASDSVGASDSMMASVGSSTEVVQDVEGLQAPATLATMTNILQDLPVGSVTGVVSSTMDVSDNASSSTGVSIAITSTQATHDSVLNANIMTIKSPLARSAMFSKKIESLMSNSSPLVTAPPINNFAAVVTASAALGVGNSSNADKANLFDASDASDAAKTNDAPVSSLSGTHSVPAGPIKKSVKMRPGSSNTARGLCSITWCEQNPRGTAAEFKAFYDGLRPAELKKYKDLARENKDKQKAGKVQ